MNSEQRPVVLIEELADMLATSVSTIRRRLRARAFPIPQIQGIDDKLRWSRAEVMAFIERGGVAPGGRSRKAA
jgi:predicted DNA-binding transcriptional regulator AlpA